MPRIEYNGQTISYEVVFTNRTTVEIRVYPDRRVVVTAPPRTSNAYIKALVQQRAEWIIEKHNLLATYTPPPVEYVSGAMHLYLGESYPLDVRKSKGKHSSATLENGYFVVHVPDPSDTKRIKRALDTWYRKRAYQTFALLMPQAMERFAKAGIDLPPFDWDTRIFNGRWGSCGRDGKVMFNVYLMRLDKSLIEYVIVHELCHLFEMNHGRAFYALLNRVMPDWKPRRKRLRGYRLR